MTLLVDTSVWSLALRRDPPSTGPEVAALREALAGSQLVVTTGFILQELLQGAVPEAVRATIKSRFLALPVVEPHIDDHVAAADVRNECRAHGVQLGTIDALLAALCIGRRLRLLSTDRDFQLAAVHVDLKLWSL